MKQFADVLIRVCIVKSTFVNLSGQCMQTANILMELGLFEHENNSCRINLANIYIKKS